MTIQIFKNFQGLNYSYSFEMSEEELLSKSYYLLKMEFGKDQKVQLKFNFTTISEARNMYVKVRDSSRLNRENLQSGLILEDGRPLACIIFSGRVFKIDK
jgi:hypothetical protein